MRDRAERQDLQARLRPGASPSTPKRVAQPRGERRGTASPARVLAHQAERALNGWPPRAERHDPREAARRDLASEVHFDLLGPGERPLELRALHERARHAEAELRG